MRPARYCAGYGRILMKELLQEYKQSLKATRKLKESVPEEDQKVVSQIISSLEFSIEWMQTGRMPGNIRSIEKQSVYKNNKFWDSSIGSYVCKSNYVDPFEEVENRIDAERRKMKHA